MAKKGFGHFVAWAAFIGAAAAGISYFLRYKSFNEELAEEFGDLDDEDDIFADEEDSDVVERNYVTLKEKREEKKAEKKAAKEDALEDKLDDEIEAYVNNAEAAAEVFEEADAEMAAEVFEQTEPEESEAEEAALVFAEEDDGKEDTEVPFEADVKEEKKEKAPEETTIEEDTAE